MKLVFKSTARQGMVVACASLLIAGIGYVFAAPTAAPPGSTIPLPLTRGASAEVKSGALTIQGLLTASAGLSVTGSTTTGTLNTTTICLGGDCKTAWPAGGGGVSTVTGSAFHPNGYCYTYNYYDQMTYYASGSSYTNYVYNCGSTNFSFTASSTVPSGRTPGTVLGGTVWCHAGGNNYSGYGTSYISDSYYPYRVAATITSIVNNNNGTVTINGNCRFTTAGNYSYAYMAMRADNLTFAY